jgi:hypothetical protein
MNFSRGAVDHYIVDFDNTLSNQTFTVKSPIAMAVIIDETTGEPQLCPAAELQLPDDQRTRGEFSVCKLFHPDVLKTIAKPSEESRCVILGVKTIWEHNPFDIGLKMTVDLFSVSDQSLQQKEKKEESEIPKHPDFHGKSSLVIPSKMCEDVPPNHAVVYQPLVNEKRIVRYAGMEDALLRPSSYCLPRNMEQKDKDTDGEFFVVGTVIPDFILHYRHHKALGIQERGDYYVTEMAGKSVMWVRNQVLDKIRDLFQDGVLGKIRYTKLEDARLLWTLSDKEKKAILETLSLQNGAPSMLYVILQLDVVMTGTMGPAAEFSTTRTKVN